MDEIMRCMQGIAEEVPAVRLSTLPMRLGMALSWSDKQAAQQCFTIEF